MRKSQILNALFPAVRQEILAATLLSPEKSWYLSALAAHLGTSPSSLQRDLEALTESGILQLRALFSKTAGIVPLLKSELARFSGQITWAAVYGSVARGEEQTQSDVDLLIVGSVELTELLPALRRIEQQFGREVNVTRYSEPEFRAKRRSRDHFLNSVLKGSLIDIVGSVNELEKATARRQSPPAPDQQKGTRRIARAHRTRS